MTIEKLEGCWGSRDLNKEVFKEDNGIFVPVLFKDLVKGDRVKHDMSDSCVYIMMSDLYNDKIDVKVIY